MDYPIYKQKKIKPITKALFLLNLFSVILCFLIPWYIYVQGSTMFIFISFYMLKKYRGYKAITGFLFSVMFMLLMFDFADGSFTWSLDYVLPSFLIFLTTLMFAIVLFKKKKWSNYYSMHSYFILLSFLIGGFMIFGVMESMVMGIVTLSIFAASLVAIWIRVGKSYHRNILKFIHI